MINTCYFDWFIEKNIKGLPMFSAEIFITIIEKSFHDVKYKTELIASLKEKLRQKQCNRFFDDFKNVLPVELSQQYALNFLELADKIKPKCPVNLDNVNKILSDKDKNNFRDWISQLAELACIALFHGKDALQPRFIELLELDQDDIARINKTDWACGFIGAAMHFMMNDQLKDYAKKNNIIFPAICNYINQHYREWTLSQMDRMKIALNDGEVYPAKLIDILPSPELAMVALGFGGVVGLTALGAYSIYKAVKFNMQEHHFVPENNKPNKRF